MAGWTPALGLGESSWQVSQWNSQPSPKGLGKGFVILPGVHPEAPASWRTGMHFNTPVDVDLAYAATLVRSAMNRTMLPHF